MKTHFIRLRPGGVSFTGFSSTDSQQRLVQALTSSSVADILVQPYTKTALLISLASRSGDMQAECLVALPDERYSFLHQREQYSYLAGRIPERYYFKSLRGQGRHELMLYLERVLERLVGSDAMRQMQVNIRFWNTEKMKTDIAEGLPYKDE